MAARSIAAALGGQLRCGHSLLPPPPSLKHGAGCRHARQRAREGATAVAAVTLTARMGTGEYRRCGTLRAAPIPIGLGDSVMPAPSQQPGSDDVTALELAVQMPVADNGAAAREGRGREGAARGRRGGSRSRHHSPCPRGSCTGEGSGAPCTSTVAAFAPAYDGAAVLGGADPRAGCAARGAERVDQGGHPRQPGRHHRLVGGVRGALRLAAAEPAHTGRSLAIVRRRYFQRKLAERGGSGSGASGVPSRGAAAGGATAGAGRH